MATPDGRTKCTTLPGDTVRANGTSSTGWLASLDLRKPYTSRILSHRLGRASCDATSDPLDTNTQDSQGDDFCFVFTFCHHTASPPSTMERRRGKPMNNLVS